MGTVIIDLDNTLVRTDLLIEASVQYLKGNPLRIFRLIGWALSGPLTIKKNLEKRIHIDASILPYDQKVIELIQSFKAQGERVMLASASPISWVQGVSNHLKLFDGALGTDTENLKGLKKYQAIVEKFGTSEFLYVGDHRSDLEIWKNCKNGIVVNGSSSVIAALKMAGVSSQIINSRTSLVKAITKLLRIRQWPKNALLFLPVLAAHTFNSQYIFELLCGFFAFSFAASSVYIFNDLFDVNSDRRHHSKKFRPIASGEISYLNSLFLFLAMVLLSFGLGVFAGMAFVNVVLAYWFLNLFYTLYLKRQVVLDILILSGMYTIRLYAGAAITATPISNWLLAYSTFFFFGLACVKRYIELLRLKGTQATGRGYSFEDADIVRILGVGSGLISILVLLLYIQSPEVAQLYQDLSYMWFMVPIMLFWNARLWVLTGRGEVDDDPVIFALKDKWSWLCLIGLALTLGASAI